MKATRYDNQDRQRHKDCRGQVRTEKTFDYTDNAAKDLAKETGKGMEKG